MVAALCMPPSELPCLREISYLKRIQFCKQFSPGIRHLIEISLNDEEDRLTVTEIGSCSLVRVLRNLRYSKKATLENDEKD